MSAPILGQEAVVYKYGLGRVVGWGAGKQIKVKTYVDEIVRQYDEHNVILIPIVGYNTPQRAGGGLLRTKVDWKRISPREMLGPEQHLLTDGVDVWIGHQAFGEHEMEWRTNDESFWDRTPTHYANMPELPGEEPS